MLSQSKGPTVAQFGCSIGKCFDSKVFFVVCLVDTGDAKMRLGGGMQMVHWKIARYLHTGLDMLRFYLYTKLNLKQTTLRK